MQKIKNTTKFIKLQKRFNQISAEEETTIRRKRLLYNSRKRGRVETELFLGSFATEKIWTLREEELDQLEDLLNETDYDIYNWMLNLKPVPEQFNTEIFRSIKKYVETKKYNPQEHNEKTFDYDYENSDCAPPK